MKLRGRLALVTGADSGIGRAVAILFAQQGADVCVGYHADQAGAAETCRLVEAAGRRAVAAQADVGDAAGVEALFGRASELGAADILVNNAGTASGGRPVAEIDDAAVERMIRTDLIGPAYCARAFVRLRLRHGGGGRIVNVSSVHEHLPTQGFAPYGMAKAGLGSLCRTLAVELAEHRINVNNICPGLIETPMTRDSLDDPDKRRKATKDIPWGRPGRPEEIARLALFLASDDADYATGQSWTIDGGLSVRWGGA